MEIIGYLVNIKIENESLIIKCYLGDIDFNYKDETENCAIITTSISSLDLNIQNNLLNNLNLLRDFVSIKIESSMLTIAPIYLSDNQIQIHILEEPKLSYCLDTEFLLWKIKELFNLLLTIKSDYFQYKEKFEKLAHFTNNEMYKKNMKEDFHKFQSNLNILKDLND